MVDAPCGTVKLYRGLYEASDVKDEEDERA